MFKIKHSIRKLMIFFLAIGLVLTGSVTSEHTASAASGIYDVKLSGTYHYNSAQKMLDLVNKLRAEQGREPLAIDKDLTDAAMQRAAECSVSFSHTRPDGTGCFTIHERMSGENIAVGSGTPGGTFDQWKNSPGHYGNMIDADYASIGIGHFQSSTGMSFWVQIFSISPAETADTRIHSAAVRPIVSTELDSSDLRFYEEGDVGKLAPGKTCRLTMSRPNHEFPFYWSQFDPGDFRWTSSDEGVAKVSTDGIVTAIGTGVAEITAATPDGAASRTIRFTVIKAAQKLKVTAKKKTVKYKKVRKKKQKVAALAVKNAKGTVSYKKVSGSKRLTVSKKTGKVTVKKGTKRGTYKIKVKVTAAGNKTYKKGSKTVTVKVVVR